MADETTEATPKPSLFEGGHFHGYLKAMKDAEQRDLLRMGHGDCATKFMRLTAAETRIRLLEQEVRNLAGLRALAEAELVQLRQDLTMARYPMAVDAIAYQQPHGPIPSREGTHALAERDALTAEVERLAMLLIESHDAQENIVSGLKCGCSHCEKWAPRATEEVAADADQA